MTTEPVETTRSRLHDLNLHIVSASLSAMGALLVAVDAKTWWQALLLAIGLTAALTAVSRRTAGRLSVLLPCLAVTTALWFLGTTVADSPTAAYGFAIVSAVVAYRSPAHRRAVALGACLVLLLGIAVRPLFSDEGLIEQLLGYVAVPLSVALTGVIMVHLNQVVSELVMELDRAREHEAELAVARERVRFAGDLHDIQGHTLHVVKLKTTLARRLVHVDAERAERELEEIHSLVGDTILRTRELAYAQRRLNLSVELENAKNLFEAAGIRVEVDREGEVDVRAGESLGQVLRETTTNILRHSEAERVWISLSESGIRVVNDGAAPGPTPELGGLAVLRERLVDQGGELTVEREAGRFTTAASLPRPLSDVSATTEKDR
ncbi:sensor histidine kinase [Nocardiopsis alba]|uniref:sensor histidine kinase n=1 Tax=Nocardiopsis alba TaxID=53437 RepID=UPI0036722DA4